MPKLVTQKAYYNFKTKYLAITLNSQKCLENNQRSIKVEDITKAQSWTTTLNTETGAKHIVCFIYLTPDADDKCMPCFLSLDHQLWSLASQ